jgi:hypothetical protein
MAQTPFTADDLRLLKQNMRQRYDSIRSPHSCKTLNQQVFFNARGFHHLLYDSSGKARSILSARNRLILIQYIPVVLLNASDSTYEKFYARKNRKKESPSISIEQWGLTHTMHNGKVIKVILRRENGA